MIFQLLMVLFLANFVNACGRQVPEGNISTTSNDSLSTDRIESCGTAPPPSSVRSKRIVGGTVAAPGSWPWKVNIKCFLDYHQCAGTLVSQRWVVTAAHCFDKLLSNPKIWQVWIGDYDKWEQDDLERIVLVDDIILHPEYVGKDMDLVNNITAMFIDNNRNDIALIHLKEDASVEPICLPSNQEISDEDLGDCWVAGSGMNMVDEYDGRLRHLSGPLIPRNKCSQMWNITMPDTVFCFGNTTHGPCPGDSGGPLMCQGPNGGYTLEGVIAMAGCIELPIPNVFTRVRPYMSWIRQHINYNLTD